MDRVFVSSVMAGFEEERSAVRSAIESLDLRPVMAETAPASVDASRTALLSRVDEADVVVLVLGARYGYVGETGTSPTEDEFSHAVSVGKPVLIFVQQGVTREPEQNAFVSRVRGTWEDGAFTASFSAPAELGYAVVKALNNLRSELTGGSGSTLAQERALTLASETRRREQPRERPARLVLAPVNGGRLLDAVGLDDESLGDAMAMAFRSRGIVGQAAGIEVRSSGNGIQLLAESASGGLVAIGRVEADGSVVVESSVAAQGSMGSMAVSEPRFDGMLRAASLWAGDAWQLLTNGDRVRQVAVAAGIVDAQYTAWSKSGQVGGSMSMSSVDSPLVVPRPPLVIRRADLGSEATVRTLLAEFRRAFMDAGGVVD